MESDDRNATSHQANTLEQASALNSANDYFGSGGNELGEPSFNEEHILDDVSREYLKFGFKKMAKTNDYILIEEIGDAFRHAGQNPSEDVVKDMVERAKAIKKPSQDGIENEINDHLTYPDFLTIVHEYWYPVDDDRQALEEAFDVLDPKRTAKLMVDDFTSLLRNCDWPEDDIDLILSQVSCADGYFIYDDLTKILLTPVELPKKRSAKPKSSGKERPA